MRLAVESYIPVKRLGIEAGLRAIAASGFSAVDFTFYFELEQLCAADTYLQTARQTAAIMRELDLVCLQAHAPFSFLYDDETSLFCPHFRNIVRAMEAAAVLGAQTIVVHAPGVPQEADRLTAALRLYRALEPYCVKYGIRVGVENLGNTLSTPEELNQLLSQLDETHFVACLDLGHAHMLGIQPQDFIQQTIPGRLQALHVHDNDGSDDQHQLPFRGTIDWNQVVAALYRYGYRGDFTMEAWRFLDDFPDVLLQDALRFEARVAAYLAAQFLNTEKGDMRRCTCM